MNRCAFFIAALALSLAAQAQRLFPAQALRGEMVVVQAPEVSLNGLPARLSPGSRIHDQSNLLQLSASLTGQQLSVNYTVDREGLIQEVWLLTPTERANRPWPGNPQEAAAWTFDPATQTWTRR